AIRRVQMTFDALHLVSTLGGIDTDPQAGELLDAVHKAGRTAVVEAIIQMRLANALQQWRQLNPSSHAAVLDGFVADVEKMGLTNSEAKLFMRIANYFGDGPDGKIVTKAL